ncbi:MAG: tellurite resistance TerB family protein [Gammaproteobacteria bacterium]
MDPRAILDQLLQSGNTLLNQGLGSAQQQPANPGFGEETAPKPLGPPQPPGMMGQGGLSGLAKGALIAGAIGMLLGTKAGRTITTTGLKIGGVAALGGLAYQAYQKWRAGRGMTPTAEGRSSAVLTGAAASERSMALLRAMVAAAKADGHIDDQERARLKAQLERMNLDQATLAMLQKELDKPLDPQDIAAGADSPEAAAEIYLASLVVLDVDNVMERAYLKELASALNLSPDLVQQIEAEVRG